MTQKLMKKINNRTAIIGIIGLGYVGLPLAFESAKSGFKTIGFDINSEKLNKINQGKSYISDVDSHELNLIVKNKIFTATHDLSLLKQVDCVLICVPTPLDKYYQTDITYIEQTAGEIVKYLHKDMLIILESTTYPGTTEEVLKPILEKSGLKGGQDFYLAFSPERVDPGNSFYNVKNTPKVVGGITEVDTDIASSLYRNIIEAEIHEVSNPMVAEMEKILENTYRNVNIALVNEMALVCDKMGINVWEVINAAKTKPYGFNAFYPGPGVGGHCIPIDPFYLTWKAREFDYHTRFIELAGEINNFMPEFVLERVMKILNKFGKALKNANIFVLGIAYKRNIDDSRKSPALKIIKKLQEYGASIKINDPFIPEIEIKGEKYYSVPVDECNLAESDLVIITTDHSVYDYEFIKNNAKYIFDTKNALSDIKQRHNIELL